MPFGRANSKRYIQFFSSFILRAFACDCIDSKTNVLEIILPHRTNDLTHLRSCSLTANNLKSWSLPFDRLCVCCWGESPIQPRPTPCGCRANGYIPERIDWQKKASRGTRGQVLVRLRGPHQKDGWVKTTPWGNIAPLMKQLAIRPSYEFAG